MAKYFHSGEPLALECGGTLPDVTIAYDTFGTLNDRCDNVVWVCHALTADSDVASWWEHTVERGKFLDPERYFVVCANFLGSHYGTTGPLSVNPDTGEPWYGDFPRFTVRDMVECHRRLAAYLGIGRVALLIGSSIGGFQCMEWAVIEPDFAERLVLIATAVRSTPWVQAFNESLRMAIELDPSFGAAVLLTTVLRATNVRMTHASITACRRTSAIRARSCAGASTPTPTTAFRRRSIRTTSPAVAEAPQTRCTG